MLKHLDLWIEEGRGLYVNSPELDDGQMDAMIQELIDKAEQLTIKELKSR